MLYALREGETPKKMAQIQYNGTNLNTVANRFSDFVSATKEDYVQQLTFRIVLKYANPDKRNARIDDQTAAIHVFLFYFPAQHGKEVLSFSLRYLLVGADVRVDKTGAESRITVAGRG